VLIGSASPSKRFAYMPVTRVKKAHPDLGQPVLDRLAARKLPLERHHVVELQKLSWGYGHRELEGGAASSVLPARPAIGWDVSRSPPVYLSSRKGCALSDLLIL
jgi:hypothetical protein